MQSTRGDSDKGNSCACPFPADCWLCHHEQVWPSLGLSSHSGKQRSRSAFECSGLGQGSHHADRLAGVSTVSKLDAGLLFLPSGSSCQGALDISTLQELWEKDPEELAVVYDLE